MPEQIGVEQVGSVSQSELIAATANLEYAPVVLPGGSAVSYAKGTALVNSATSGLMAKYTNATEVAAESLGNGDGSTTTFDLANANVVAKSLKGYVAGVQWDATISKGTGTGGVDQIVFAVAPTNSIAITVDYDYHASAAGVEGACILFKDEETTVAGGNVTTNGIVGGDVYGDKVLDAAGNAVDDYFKDALKRVMFL